MAFWFGVKDPSFKGVGIPILQLGEAVFGMGVLSRKDVSFLVIGVLGNELEIQQLTSTTFLLSSSIAKMKYKSEKFQFC